MAMSAEDIGLVTVSFGLVSELQLRCRPIQFFCRNTKADRDHPSISAEILVFRPIKYNFWVGGCSTNYQSVARKFRHNAFSYWHLDKVA